jgi:Mg-chelatase subunit ChlD
MRRWLRILICVAASAALLGLCYPLLWRPAGSPLDVSLWGRELSLQAPRWLALGSLLPLLWLLASGSLVDMSRPQRWLSLGLRGLLLLALALALARPAVTDYQQRICTVFAVDVSASISDRQLARARELVARAVAARGDNEVRLLTFAGSPRGVPLSRDKPVVPPLSRHPGAAEREQSDIQAALQHAYGQFPRGVLRRVVLLTDGNQTRGDLQGEARRAASRGIRLYALSLPPRQDKEVMVRSLELPDEVRVGAPFYLAAEIHATHAEQVTLTLYKDEFINGLDGRRKLTLRPGKNRVSFKSMVREAGTVRYRLKLTGARQDTWAANNLASAVLPVLGRPRVLYVEGEPMYSNYLAQALEAEKIDVVTRGPHGVPGSAAQLQKFDLLLLSDVPAMYVGPGQMGAIAAYVRNLGGGFIMAGGPNSFGAGGYYGTRIEKILPVRFDTEKKRDQPTLALVLCIDRSGSMSGIKMELAKDAAKATTEILGNADLIGVVVFDSSARVLVRLQRAANRMRILNDIARLSAGGGTNIRPALQEAFNQLRGARAKVKHVILLSDGQSSYAGIEQLVDEMAGGRITVSAVGVGSGADQTLLQMIAERGGGRFYHTQDPRNIPKIFTKETTQVARSALVEEPVRVRPVKRANVIQGIDWGGAPALRGYVSTKPKPSSETLLVSHHGEPILSIWRQGLGKTAAFTSDVKSRWAAAWLRWRGYRQFWAQLVREVMRHRIQRSFEMRASVAQGQVRVTVDALDRADRFINGLDSTLALVDPARPGQRLKLPLLQTAAGRYEARFRLPSYGSYLLQGTHKADGKLVAQSLASLSASYPEEYTHLLPDNGALGRAAAVTGGRLDPSPSALFDPGDERIRFSRAMWPWALYLALGLFLLDVLLRRVRIFGHRTDMEF